MAIFVAKAAIDEALSKFADFDLLEASTIDSSSSSDLKAHSGNVAFEFTSTVGDFHFDPIHGQTGTISTIDVKVGGVEAYNLSDVSLSFEAFRTAFGANEIADFLKTIFAGDDTITGSKFNDTIAGFDGSDTLKGGKGNDLFSSTQTSVQTTSTRSRTSVRRTTPSALTTR